MIKKFEEYISEGFWKDGIKRAKSNTKRIENSYPQSFIQQNNLHKVEGYNDYYISIHIIKNTCVIHIYHEPNPEYIDALKCTYFVHGRCPDILWSGDLNHCDFMLINDGVTDEEFDTIYTDEFVDALKSTLKKLPNDTWS